MRLENGLFGFVSAFVFGRFVTAMLCVICLSGCVTMKLSEPKMPNYSSSARIVNYQVERVCISNSGFQNKAPATEYMDVNVDAIRRECNKTCHDATNCIPVTVSVRRISKSYKGFFIGLEQIISACTLAILPLYDLSTFKYEIDIIEDKQLIGSTSAEFKRWNAGSLLPIPFLFKISNTGYYWFGAAGRGNANTKKSQFYWVSALGEYEEKVISEAIIKYLSSAEMQNVYKDRLREKEMFLRLEKERLEKNAKIEAKVRAEEEEKRKAAEKAEKLRVARGPLSSDFFGVPLRKDVSKEMREQGVFSEETGIKGALMYSLGREGALFRREIKGSRTFNHFRIRDIYTEGETNGIVAIFAEGKGLSIGREFMSARAQQCIKEISKVLNYKEVPDHRGSATEHTWMWFPSKAGDRLFSVQLCAKVCENYPESWGFMLNIYDREWFENVRDKRFTHSNTKDEEKVDCSGTAWFVQSNILVTCEHVVHNAKEIKFCDLNRVERKAKLLNSSEEHDLAILRVEDYTALELLPLKARLEKMGAHVFTIGYPLADFLGTNQKYTDGVISSTAGLNGDSTCYQISVPIQPGNSGGALVNDSGEVVGVTSSCLDAIFTAKITGTLPQNVNYAIKSRYIVELLEDNGITYLPKSNGKADVSKVGKATVQLKVRK